MAAGDPALTPPEKGPAYKALASELRQAILAGKFPPHQKLPTETQLAASRGLSRDTVRQAYRELVEESLVYRIRGRGSFAVPVPKGAYHRSFASIDDLLHLSDDTEVEVIEPIRLRTDPAAAGRLELATDQVMAGVYRRSHEGVVFQTTDVFLPVDVGRLLEGKMEEIDASGARSNVTVLELLESRAGVQIAGAAQSILAVPASREVAARIECEPGQPVLRIDRIYYDRTGRRVQLASASFNQDRYSYRLELRR
jgi:DNA-binding GntR family transcriptional regulator